MFFTVEYDFDSMSIDLSGRNFAKTIAKDSRARVPFILYKLNADTKVIDRSDKRRIHGQGNDNAGVKPEDKVIMDILLAVKERKA